MQKKKEMQQSLQENSTADSIKMVTLTAAVEALQREKAEWQSERHQLLEERDRDRKEIRRLIELEKTWDDEKRDFHLLLEEKAEWKHEKANLMGQIRALEEDVFEAGELQEKHRQAEERSSLQV
tara:strand:+ start:203 stop:574 length:372 start_codon:yes stop_codon:yes gene_type:complete